MATKPQRRVAENGALVCGTHLEGSWFTACHPAGTSVAHPKNRRLGNTWTTTKHRCFSQTQPDSGSHKTPSRSDRAHAGTTARATRAMRVHADASGAFAGTVFLLLVAMPLVPSSEHCS